MQRKKPGLRFGYQLPDRLPEVFLSQKQRILTPMIRYADLSKIHRDIEILQDLAVCRLWFERSAHYATRHF